MESSIFKKATKFLQEHKNNHRWQAVFLTMALVVALGTVGVLTLTGHAETYKVKRLVCKVADHTHTSECYGSDGKLICDKPEMILHTHNTVDCYNDDGVLICKLDERKPHVHTDDCYEETEVLTCDMQEGEGHQHTDDCYKEVGGGELICDTPEHTHGDECYDENGSLICETEEHTHTDACLSQPERVLDCGMEESEGHYHTKDCYKTRKKVICGNTYAEHRHTDECYTEHRNKDTGEVFYTLDCGMMSAEIHTHGSECFVEEDVTADELMNGDGSGGDDSDLGGDNNEPGENAGGSGGDDNNLEGDGNNTGDDEGVSGEHDNDLGAGGGTETPAEDQEGEFEKILICDLEEHQHSDDCRDPETGEYICEKTEHEHTAECYGFVEKDTEESADTEERESESGKVLICGLEEHRHSDDCRDPETGEYICEKTEHEHTAECYGFVEKDTEESDDTEQIDDSNTEESSEGDSDTAGTGELICGKEEHVHGDECYAISENPDEPSINGERVLICDKEEHTHTSDCYADGDSEASEDAPAMMRVVACGEEAHEHEAGCLAYGCGKMSHKHTDACYMDVYEDPKTYADDDVTVKAYYGKDAGLDDAVLEASPVSSELVGTYEDAVKNMPDMEGKDITSVELYDIGFYRMEDGVKTEVEPADGSKVLIKMQFSGKDGIEEGRSLTVVHFTDDGDVEKLSTSEGSGSCDASFVTGSFSVFAIADGEAGAAPYGRGYLEYIMGGLLLCAAGFLLYIEYQRAGRRRRRM